MAPSTKSSRTRIAALAVGSVLALPAGWLAWVLWLGPRAEPSSETRVVGDLEAMIELLTQRARGGPRRPDPRMRHEDARRGLSPDAPPLVRGELPEEDALVLMPHLVTARAGVAYDVHTLDRFRAHLRRSIPVHSHPDGAILFQTNGVGLREADEILDEKPDLRVLVAGDSHTEGYCNVEESWPNVLEALVRARSERTAEVLNAGKSGYSFYNYLGVLEKFAPLGVDVFVMAVYGGNDFGESLPVHRYHRRLAPPRCLECDVRETIAQNPDVPANVFIQGLAQVRYFRHHPEARELALEAALSVTGAVHRACHDAGMHLVCVYIPPMMDAQADAFRSVVDAGLAASGLGAADLAVTGELADAWLAFVRARDIPSLDLRAVFAAQAQPLYSQDDFHLNLHANALVAQALLPLVAR